MPSSCPQKPFSQAENNNYRDIRLLCYCPRKEQSPVVFNSLIAAHPINNRPVSWFSMFESPDAFWVHKQFWSFGIYRTNIGIMKNGNCAQKGVLFLSNKQCLNVVNQLKRLKLS
ncbi:hypothetical protein MSWHS_0898 [Methanosarcina sp. WWM596]|nr:hypothetical protein MSWHS_0898 [Methanosarcina sp. WWM596]